MREGVQRSDQAVLAEADHAAGAQPAMATSDDASQRLMYGHNPVTHGNAQLDSRSQQRTDETDRNQQHATAHHSAAAAKPGTKGAEREGLQDSGEHGMSPPPKPGRTHHHPRPISGMSAASMPPDDFEHAAQPAAPADLATM